MEKYACVQRKDFPRDFWNHHLNPITGARAKTIYETTRKPNPSV